MLEDSELWPDEVLRGLCKKLVLEDFGPRDEIIERLRVWHVSKHRGQAFQGSNFHLLPVKDKTVMPQYLSPFKRIDEQDRKSILRVDKRARSDISTSLDMRFSTPSQSPNSRRRSGLFESTDTEDDDSRVPETSPKRGKHGNRKRKKGVQFSPYNRVQLISPRKPGDNDHVRQLYQSIQEGSYENSEDEEQEWSRSVSAASEPSPE